MDSKKRRKKVERQKRIPFRLIVMIVLVGMGVFFWKPAYAYVQNAFNFRSAHVDSKSVVELPLSGIISTIVVKDRAIVMLPGKLQAYDIQKSKLWEIPLKENTTFMKGTEESVLVRSGKDFEIEEYNYNGKRRGKIKTPGEFDDVFKTDVGLVFTNKSSGHITWTNLDGKITGAVQITGARALKTIADPITGDAMVSVLRGEGGTIESSLQRFDTEGRCSTSCTFRDSIILDFQYTENRLIIVLDNKFLILDKDMKDLSRNKDNALFQGIGFGSYGYWLCKVKPENQRVLQCYLYKNTEKPKGSIVMNEEATIIAAGPNEKVAVASNQLLKVYDSSEKVLMEENIGQVPKRIHWMDESHILLEISGGARIIDVGGAGFL